MSAFPESGRSRLGETTSVAAARALRAAIMDGRLGPSQPLREEELARNLGISRTPVREALRLLEAEGLVDVQPNRGATVKRYSAEDLEDVYTLRAVLEGYAARAAARGITPRQIELLEESNERYARIRREAAETLPELVEENLTFHRTIVEAAGSARLSAMIRNVTAVPFIYMSYMTYSDDHRRVAEEDHRAIVRALGERDGERAGIIQERHVLWARDLAIAHLDDIVPGERREPERG